MKTGPTVRLRAARRADERGSSSVEALLLLPAMMLLAVFVLWAGRAGQAALATDLAAEEAATVAALHCEQGKAEECGALVSDVLSTNSQLDFLCVGGPRAVGDDPLVQQAWLRGGLGGGPLAAEDVGVLGVRFGCETDGAVAPLRGLLPNVTFYGQSTEVAVRPSLPTLRIWDAPVGVSEGSPLKFLIQLTEPVGQAVTLDYTISAETPYTSAPSDYADGPALTVTILADSLEATITVVTDDDTLHEADEQIMVRLGAVPVDAVSGNPLLSYSDAQGLGTIEDNDDLMVTVADSEPAQEEVDEFVVFEVEVTNAGRDGVVTFNTEDIGDQIGHATHGTACVDLPTPDYQFMRTVVQFRPDLVSGTVEVPLCPDVEAEPLERFNLQWAYGDDPTGTAEGTIEADKMRLFVSDNCDEARLVVALALADADACGLETSEDVVGADGEVEFIVSLAPVHGGFPPGFGPVTVQYVARPVDSLATVENPATGWGTEVQRVDPCAAPGAALLPLESVKEDGDFESVQGVLTFEDVVGGDPTAVKTLPVAVPVYDDALDEYDEVFWLTLCSISSTVRTSSDQGLGVIVDDDLEPHLSVSDAQVEEGDEKVDGDVWLEFDVRLDAVSAKDVTVEYNTDDLRDPEFLENLGTDRRPALVNDDYRQILELTNLTIPAGQDSATIRVDIVEDRFVEGADEVFAVRLRAFNATLVSSESLASVLCEDDYLGDDCAVGTIIEDDLLDIDGDGTEDSPRHLEIADAMAYEGQDLKFLIKLMDDEGALAPIGVELVVHVETQGLPSDYKFDYGRRNGFHDELYYMRAIDGTEHSLISRALDRDYGASFPARSVPANPDSDYEPMAVTSVIIPANEAQVEVTVRTLSDTIDEHYERFALRVRSNADFLPIEASTNCVGPDVRVGPDVGGLISKGVADGHSDDCAVGTIADLNPIPRVAVDWRNTVEGRDAEFTMRLVDQYSGAGLTSAKGTITLVGSTQETDLPNLARSGTACGELTTFGGYLPDFEAASVPVVLDPGESVATFNVTICADSIPESVVEVFKVSASASVEEHLAKSFSDALEGDRLTSTIIAKIYDADRTRVVVAHTGSETGSVVLEGQKALFEVRVLPRAEPGEEPDGYPEVSVDWHIRPKSYGADAFRESADAGDDYVDDFGELTFGSYESVKLIEVQTIDDEISEAPEGFEVVLSNPSEHLVLTDHLADALIIDNDCWDMTSPSPPGVHLVSSDGPEAGSHTLTVEMDHRICGTTEYRVRANPITASSADLDSDWIEYRTPFYTDGYHKLEAEALLVFLEGLVLKRFHVPITEDEIDEEHETYRIEFEWNSGRHRGIASAPSSEATIYDDDTSLVTVDDASGIEGETLIFFVRLSVPNSRRVTIDYETREAHSSQNPATGAAVGTTVCAPGDDFIHEAGSVTVQPGQTSAAIVVRLCGDTRLDGGEQLLLWIEGSTGIPLPATIEDNIGEGTILDLSCVDPRNPRDPVPVISATHASVTFREDDRSASISVELDPPFCHEQTAALKFSPDFLVGTADAADLPTGDAPLYSGVASRTAVATVALLHTTGDGIEEDETYTWTVNWDPDLLVQNSEYDSTLDVEIEVTLIDGDDGSLPVVTLVQDASASRATEGGDVPFEVQLDRAATETVTVHYETEDVEATLADYWPTSTGELTLDPGDTGGRILVTTKPDPHNIDDQDETFLLRLTGADNAELNATSDFAVGTILEPCVDPRDPDAPAVTITPVLDPSSAPLIGRWTEGETTVQVHFELSHRLCSPATVRYVVGVLGSAGGTATPGVDFVRRSGLVWVPRLEWKFPLDVALLEDTQPEQEETLVVSVKWDSGTPWRWRSVAAVHATGAIEDNELYGSLPTLSVDSPDAVEGSDLVFEVELSNGPNTAVSVDVATRRLYSGDAAWPGRDYFDFSGTLEFGPGERLKLVRVRTVPDDDVEPHEKMQLRLSNPSEDVVMATRIGTGTIVDDDCFSLDSFGPADSPPPLVFHERSGGELLGSGSEGSQIRFVVAPARRICETVYLQAEALPVSAAASDFHADPVVLDSVEVLFDGVGEFEVSAHTDNLIELNETFEVTAHWDPRHHPSQFYDPVTAGPLYSTTATIFDETASPTVTANSPQVVEGETVEFEITLGALGDRTVRMRYHTRDGTATKVFDYEPAQGTLVFRPGDLLTKRIEVPTRIDIDGGEESNETFELVLHDPENAVFSGPGDMVVEAMIEDFESRELAGRLPINVSVEPAERALVVRWDPPTLDGVAADLTGYVIKVVPVSGQLYEPPTPGRVDLGADVTEVRVGDLVAGVTYRVTVGAKFSDGENVSAEPVLGTPLALGTPLGPPQNVRLAPTAYYRRFVVAEPTIPVPMQVSWSRPAPADGVLATELRWALAETPPADPAWREALVGPGQRTYETSRNILLGQTYQMWVRHWNPDGPGDWAKLTGHVVFEPGRIPISVTSSGSGALAVALGNPEWDGGTPITGYDVEYRGRNSSAPWSGANVSVDVAQRTAEITGLQNGTWYAVRARAFNASLSNSGEGPGKGEWSLEQFSVASTVPDAPVIYKLRPGDTSMEVYWRKPADDGGYIVGGYKVRYRKESSLQWSQANVEYGIHEIIYDSSDAIITGLTNHTDYVVQVQAYNGSTHDIGFGRGVGPWSLSMTATVQPPAVPEAPRAVQVEGAAKSGLNVQWIPPADDGGADIEDYEVQWKSLVAGYDDFYHWTRSAYVSYLDHDEQGGDVVGPMLAQKFFRHDRAAIQGPVQYEVRVRARSSAGFGPWSDGVVSTMAYAPSAPMNASASVEGTGGIRLEWEHRPSAGGAPITEYFIFWRERGDECESCWYDAPTAADSVTVLATNTSTNTYLIDGLDPSKKYTVGIRALNLGANRTSIDSLRTAHVTVDLAALPPAAHVILRAAVAGDSRVTIDWEERRSARHPIHNIHLRWRPQGGTDADWEEVTFDFTGPRFGNLDSRGSPFRTTKRAHTIDDLTNGTTYEFQGSASDSRGRGAWTATTTATAGEMGDAPQNFAVRAWDRQFKLTWDWTDTTTPITGFEIRWRPSDASAFANGGHNTRNGRAVVAASDREYLIDLRSAVRGLVIRDTFVIEITAVDGSTSYGTATVSEGLHPVLSYVLEEFLPSYETEYPWLRTVMNLPAPFTIYGRPYLPRNALGQTSLAGHTYFAQTKGGCYPEHDLGGATCSRYPLESKAYASDVALKFTAHWDVLRDNPSDTWVLRNLAHEMAHVLTQDGRLVTSALAALWLQHYLWIGGDDSCEVDEVLADTISYVMFPVDNEGNDAIRYLSYYAGCDAVSSPTPEILDSTRAALAGDMPQWFVDRYTRVDDSWNMVGVWNDFNDPSNMVGVPEDAVNRSDFLYDHWSPFHGFGKLFGGYCSVWEANESKNARMIDRFYGDLNTTLNTTSNPFVDGGCESRNVRNAEALPLPNGLVVGWDRPLFDGDGNLIDRLLGVNGYVVQWKTGNEVYDPGRTRYLRGLTDTTTTILGLTPDTVYTVRIAVVRGSEIGIMWDYYGNRRFVEIEDAESGA